MALSITLFVLGIIIVLAGFAVPIWGWASDNIKTLKITKPSDGHYWFSILQIVLGIAVMLISSSCFKYFL